MSTVYTMNNTNVKIDKRKNISGEKIFHMKNASGFFFPYSKIFEEK